MLPLQEIVSDPYLMRARVYGFHVREILDFYNQEQMMIPAWRFHQLNRTAEDYYDRSIIRIRTLYGVSLDDLTETSLCNLLDRVFLGGESWDLFVYYLQRVLDES